MSLSASPDRRGLKQCSRLVWTVWSAFLTISLVLSSGPLPAAVSARGQDHRQASASADRDGGNEHNPGQTRSQPSKADGEKHSKQGSKGKPQGHHQGKKNNHHQQSARGGHQTGNGHHPNHKKQASNNEGSSHQDHSGKKSPHPAHHHGHGKHQHKHQHKHKDKNKQDRAKKKKAHDKHAAATAELSENVDAAPVVPVDTVAAAEPVPDGQTDGASEEATMPETVPAGSDDSDPPLSEERASQDSPDEPITSDIAPEASETANNDAAAESESANSSAATRTVEPPSPEPDIVDRPDVPADRKEPSQDKAPTADTVVAPALEPNESVREPDTTSNSHGEEAATTSHPAPDVPEIQPKTEAPATMVASRDSDPEGTEVPVTDVEPLPTVVERPLPEPPPVSTVELRVTPTVPVTVSPQEEAAVKTPDALVPVSTVITIATPEIPETPSPTPEPVATEIPTLEPETSPAVPSSKELDTKMPTVEPGKDDSITATPMPILTATPTATPVATPAASKETEVIRATKAKKQSHRSHQSRHNHAAAARTSSMPAGAANTADTTANSTVSPTSVALPAPPPAASEPTIAPTPTAVATTPEPVEFAEPHPVVARSGDQPAPMPEPPPVETVPPEPTPSPSPSAQPMARSDEHRQALIVPTSAALPEPPRTPAIAALMPTPTPEAAPAGVEAISIEAMPADHDVMPGEPTRYRFQLTNTARTPLTVLPTVRNSHNGWAGDMLQGDGTTMLDDPLTIGPGESAIVFIALSVPADARVGDRNTISLHLSLADGPEDLGKLPAGETFREPQDELSRAEIGRGIH
jgi:hypothetical protein